MAAHGAAAAAAAAATSDEDKDKDDDGSGWLQIDSLNKWRVWVSTMPTDDKPATAMHVYGVLILTFSYQPTLTASHLQWLITW